VLCGHEDSLGVAERADGQLVVFRPKVQHRRGWSYAPRPAQHQPYPAEVKERETLRGEMAETLGFSRRARGGRTVNPEIPTIRQSSPIVYSVSVVSSVRQTIRSYIGRFGFQNCGCFKKGYGSVASYDDPRRVPT
jgi:hypothetical protein